MENTDSFERVFITLVAERVEVSGMSHSEFGRRVFGAASESACGAVAGTSRSAAAS
jgi:hypothetical protein